MPIYVRQTEKLGDINHDSKDMAKVYGKDKLVFNKYLKAGTVLYDKLSIFYDPKLVYNDTSSNYIQPEIVAKYNTSQGGINLGKRLKQVKNGIIIKTAQVWVKTPQSSETSNFIVGSSYWGMTTFLSAYGFGSQSLPNEIKLPLKQFKDGVSFTLIYSASGTWYWQANGIIKFYVADNQLQVDLTPAQGVMNVNEVNNIYLSPIVSSITAY